MDYQFILIGSAVWSLIRWLGHEIWPTKCAVMYFGAVFHFVDLDMPGRQRGNDVHHQFHWWLLQRHHSYRHTGKMKNYFSYICYTPKILMIYYEKPQFSNIHNIIC